eukprot:TRINITY_DN4377_c0_g1_i1.p2 TRINITY_DN4377_c0_g1~~TRINITY_DN4377_c0_g1_i1.p2  ORF type:complete len:123 (+),score=17.50 TRINITY_DN4377_c0_g1_i1:466-834(+)
MVPLQYWMFAVAGLRIFGAAQAFFNSARLRTNVYSRQPREVTSLHTRLFGIWTLMSCTLCLATAYDPANRSVLLCAWVSFVLALAHFIQEAFIFRTSSIRDIIPPFIVAGTSIVWIGSILFL